MRPFLLLAVAATSVLGACSVSWTSSSSHPTLTVSGPRAEAVAFVEAQIARHPELMMTRADSQSAGATRITLAVPATISGDELLEMASSAIDARLTTEVKT